MLKFPAGRGTHSGQNIKGEGRGLTEALAVSDREATSPDSFLGLLARSSNGLCVCVCA